MRACKDENAVYESAPGDLEMITKGSFKSESEFNCIHAEVTGVTEVTARRDWISRGNTDETAKVTGATEPDIDDLIADAIDPRDNAPPDGLKEIHPFPEVEERPKWGVYEDWCGPENKYRPGVYFHGMTKGSGQVPPAPYDDWVCDPLLVEATTRDRDGHSFGMMLKFRDKLGNLKAWNMPARLLAARGCDGLLGELFDLGLHVDYDKRSRIPAYINAKIPKRTMWAAAQVGWCGGAFVLPHRVIGDDENEVFFQSESTGQKEYTASGSLEEWRGQVAAQCLGNPLLLFQVAAAFAGPLLNLCNVDGAGFHSFGPSSCGKTTGSKLAASVWGHYKLYMRSWKATANGLEGAACLFNDGLLVLDEMNDGDGHEVERTIYALGNGKGKQRASVSGSAKGVRAWRILTLSNGEKTIEAHLAAYGLTVKAGQLVRLLQIPVFGEYGAFDDLHGQPDGKAFADAVTGHALRYYGTAGIAYLERLTAAVKNSEDIVAVVKRIACLIASDELSSQEGRAASSFSLVATAGELATEYGVTGWPPGAAIEAAKACFAQWRGHRGTGNTERIQIFRMLSDYINKFGDARFTDVDDNRQLNGPRSGYWRERDHKREWLLTPTGMRDAVTGFDTRTIKETLSQAGWMLPLDKDGKLPQVKVRGKNDRYYVIRLPDGGEYGA